SSRGLPELEGAVGVSRGPQLILSSLPLGFVHECKGSAWDVQVVLYTFAAVAAAEERSDQAFGGSGFAAMEGDEEKSGDFYAVLGLKKECSMAELWNAYKKLAMKWHPDKCPASGNKIRMDKAKEKFQEIQKAYSVLSDSNKRFLYDVGVYDKDDEEDEEGWGRHWGDRANDEPVQTQRKP
ncbi:unnamed protein product, partial [Musa hybrid cultivar]